MMKQNQKDLKPVQKAKAEKASSVSNSAKFTNKSTKDSFASISTANTDNNLVYLYW